MVDQGGSVWDSGEGRENMRFVSKLRVHLQKGLLGD